MPDPGVRGLPSEALKPLDAFAVGKISSICRASFPERRSFLALPSI
jgi:hypothetical protein